MKRVGGSASARRDSCVRQAPTPAAPRRAGPARLRPRSRVPPAPRPPHRSICVVSEDDSAFMVLTAAGAGSASLPRHCLADVATSSWSGQRVVAEGTACFWAAGNAQGNADTNTGSNSNSSGSNAASCGLPGDCERLCREQRLRSFLAVPIRAGAQLVGVLHVALLAEINEQKHW